MVATLRRPESASKPPLVMLLPGLDSTKEEFLYWENVFLKRGLATLSLDGPGQGECGYQMRIRADYEAAVSTVIDFLERRKDVDLKRVGLSGVSLGGYYAPRAAAFEPRVKASVGNCGPWNWAECWPHLPQLSRTAYVHHSGSKDEAEALVKANEISFEGWAGKLKTPVLIIHGKLDRLIPWQQAHKIVDAIGNNATLAMYENGNHVCNNIPYIYRPLNADWLKEKLG
jgi:2,6-dihydroxypseudooxynicotine hydrolase